MSRMYARAAFGIAYSLLLCSAPTWAQSASSGTIAGVVTDASAAVLPGVTVEAASPALIEKVRVVTTDSQGRYSIVDLRPGKYSVTFALPGFNTVRREGLELTAGFTATSNAQLQVGAVAETIVVSGASPVVDVQNSRTQVVVQAALLDALPMSKANANNAYVELVPGSSISYHGRDVGGSLGEPLNAPSIHGSDPGLTMIDGITSISAHSSQFNKINPNPLSIQETVVETGNGSAEAWTGGVNINIVSKDGGNVFHGIMAGNFAGQGWDTSNLTDALRARGLQTTNRLTKIYDWEGGFGGPLVTNRLWFYISPARNWTGNTVAGAYYNLSPHTNRFAQDLSRPATIRVNASDVSGRVTWQATPKQKVVFQNNKHSWCNQFGPDTGIYDPAAGLDACFAPQNLLSATWSNVVSSKLLIEATGAWRTDDDYNDNPVEAETLPTDRPYFDQTLNLNYGSFFASPPIPNGSILSGQRNAHHWITRGTLSYVTGSHTLKAGWTTTWLNQSTYGKNYFDEQYVYRGGVPAAVNQATTPDSTAFGEHLFGLFAQDQWALRRLTVNAGLRFDAINGYEPAQVRAASTYLGAVSLPRVENIPNWKDISPRLGASWDVFGTGRTAVKASLGRYELSANYGLQSVTKQAGPLGQLVLATTRSWNDNTFPAGDPRNGNLIPDCDFTIKTVNGECGAMANQNFGTQFATTHYSDGVLQGWGVSPYLWQGQVSVQHQLAPNVGLTAGYYRTSYGNIYMTDNLAVTPADFTPYTLTVPFDSRLPGGGGNTLSGGLFDVSPSKFGQVNNLVELAPDRSQTYNGVDVLLNARFGKGFSVGGGVSSGKVVIDNCATPDVPAQFCRQTQSWSYLTQVKLNAVAPLPWGMQVSAVYQDIPGITQNSTAVFSNTQIFPSLNRNLAACPAPTGACSATVVASIVTPYTQFEPREHQLDLRFSKGVQFGRARIQGNVDLFNVFNIGTVQLVQARFGGPTWLTPQSVLSARFVKIGGQIVF
jgi:hypothetical protein